MEKPKGPHIEGVEVREEDLEPQRGLRFMSFVFRSSAALIFVLALWQFVAWWMDRPPGGVGLGVLIGDTIRLVVFSALLWAAGDLARLLIKTHYDVRAARILLARQTHIMKMIGLSDGAIPPEPPAEEERRGIEA